MLCLADNTLLSIVIDVQLFLWPCTHAHTHTHVRKAFVININIIGVVTVKCFGQKELGVV